MTSHPIDSKVIDLKLTLPVIYLLTMKKINSHFDKTLFPDEEKKHLIKLVATK